MIEQSASEPSAHDVLLQHVSQVTIGTSRAILLAIEEHNTALAELRQLRALQAPQGDARSFADMILPSALDLFVRINDALEPMERAAGNMRARIAEIIAAANAAQPIDSQVRPPVQVAESVAVNGESEPKSNGH